MMCPQPPGGTPQVQNYKRQEGLLVAGKAQCSFNVLEAGPFEH